MIDSELRYCLVAVWFAVGRTEPNLDDLGLAFDELHIVLSELRKYVENVDSTPFAHDVVEFPAPKSSRLQPVEQDQAAETAADRKNGLAPSGSQMDLEGSLIGAWLCRWGTGIRGLTRCLATLPQGNQEPLVVSDKVGKPSGEFGYRYSRV